MKSKPLFNMPVVVPTPRRPRRVLMHVIDAGPGDVDRGHVVRMACRKCGYESDWFQVETVTEGKRGKPCPNCNSKEF